MKNLILVGALVLVGTWLGLDYLPRYQMEVDNQGLATQTMSMVIPNTGYFSEHKPASTSMLFVGDIMLDRTMRRLASDRGYDYFFASVTPIFAEYDQVIGNLEGPITQYQSKTYPYTGLLQFTFDPAVAEAFLNAGFTVLGLGNNHMNDFGGEGYMSTQKYLREVGLKYYGDYFNKESNIIGLGDIALVGYHEFGGGRDGVVQDIQAAKTEHVFVIVTPHWGDEYVVEPNAFQRETARMFIDAGADAVIGTHPHVIQNIEWYKNKPIYYSLGNFVFDQYFSPETQKGLGVGVYIQGDTMSFREIYFQIGTEREPSRPFVLK